MSALRVWWLVTSFSANAMWKKIVLLFTLVAMSCQQAANAQALPVLEASFGGVMNEAIGGAVAANLARRGITVAANDAVFQSTMNFIGTAVNDANYASAAVTTVAAIAGAPVWLTTALGLGALAAVGGVAWGIYQFTQNNGTGTLPNGQPVPASLSLTPSSTGAGTGTLASPAPVGFYQLYNNNSCNSFTTTNCPTGLPTTVPTNLPYEASVDNYTFVACVSGADCAQQLGAILQQKTCGNGAMVTNCVLSYQSQGMQGVIGGQPTETFITRLDYDNYTVDPSTGQQVIGTHSFATTGGGGVTPNYGYVAPAQPVTGSLSSLPITSSMLSQPLPAALTAQMANQLWQNAAAKPGYVGEPYSSTNPITEADVGSASVHPTFGDLVEGLPAPSGSTTVPIAPTGITPVTNPGTGTGTGTGITSPASSVDPCAIDPSASACAPLGSAPAAPPIPTSSTSVAMSPWSVGPADGACPSPKTFEVFGSSYSLAFDPLCSLVQSIRPVVLALCALAAAFIVAMGVTA
ncbi:virulence factor TspB C-terminal domain-related protein [Trinickia sp. EG282A]|uniref:virulence factor TspB C-terminal domain-related protein n=1 Tax=Trinickia sp. EG282A TaxID=3237013 RepID=UPI0034D33D82